MDLQLQSDLNDIERRNAKAGLLISWPFCEIRERMDAIDSYRETRPAIPPARTTCRLVPYFPQGNRLVWTSSELRNE